jgi:hypothetical protein
LFGLIFYPIEWSAEKSCGLVATFLYFLICLIDQPFFDMSGAIYSSSAIAKHFKAVSDQQSRL